jgi:hypothetical protein
MGRFPPPISVKRTDAGRTIRLCVRCSFPWWDRLESREKVSCKHSFPFFHRREMKKSPVEFFYEMFHKSGFFHNTFRLWKCGFSIELTFGLG